MGCDGPSQSPLDPDQSEARLPPHVVGTGPDNLRTFDDRLAAIGIREPAFAGLYSDGSGTLVLSVTDRSRSGSARAQVEREFSGARLLQRPTEVRTVAFSFADLYRWKQRLSSDLWSIEGVHSLDIDERLNRLQVGVESAETAEAVRSAVRDQQLPDEAVHVSVEDRGTLLSSLQSGWRAVPGAVRIEYSDGFSVSSCTLGFNAEWEGKRVFTTNRHCSSNWGQVDSTAMYQPEEGDPFDYIGNEIADDRWLFNSDTSDCPVGKYCQYHDLSMAEYDPDTNFTHGVVLTPVERVRWNGSIDVDSDPSDDFLGIQDEILWPLQGDTVDKVGQTTGWTYGPVVSTCVDKEPVYDHVFMCTYVAEAGVDGGDSGSGVFFYGTSPEHFELTGQAFAGGPPKIYVDGDSVFSEFWFANWNSIQTRYGDLNTIAGDYP